MQRINKNIVDKGKTTFCGGTQHARLRSEGTGRILVNSSLKDSSQQRHMLCKAVTAILPEIARVIRYL